MDSRDTSTHARTKPRPMTEEETSEPLLSIGALSRATGVPANTLRTWERRYGFPSAERSAGGQRQYAASLVPHLALVQRALAKQHRPRQVLSLNFTQLQDLLGMAQVRATTLPRSGPIVQMLLDATTALDSRALDHLLNAGISRWGAVPFIEEHLMPFLQAVGENWAAGSMNIFHEHFASERVVAVLQAHWQRQARASYKPPIVLSTLPHEQHVMGLHMAATVFAQASYELLFLGPNTPLDDLLDCAKASNAAGIAVSVSIHADPAATTEHLQELVMRAPAGTQILVGGAGAPDVEGTHTLRTLTALAQWAEN